MDKYLLILGFDVSVRCPFLLAGDRIYVEDRILKALLPIENVTSKVQLVFEAISHEARSGKDIVEGLQILEDNLENLRNKLDAKYASLSEKVGIGLEARSENKKITKRGMIYSESLVDYTKFGYPIGILSDISGQICEKLDGNLRVPVRFGGEGRMALMEIREGAKVLSEINNYIWKREKAFTGKLALYVVSPLLFKSGESLNNQVREYIESMGLKFLHLYGEAEIIGGGYSLEAKRRKPLYISLKPGSIIFTEAKNCNLAEIYWSGVGGSIAKIGYGTIIPIPLQ